MARPKSEQGYIIQKRNEFIRMAAGLGISQADIARIFRLPRNTVNTVLKLPFNEKGQ